MQNPFNMKDLNAESTAEEFPSDQMIDLFAELEKKRAEECRLNFYEFAKEFWDTIISEEPIWNWHIKKLCKQLEKLAWEVFLRKPKRYDLIVNIPPGTTKSTIATQMFPAWCWVAKIPKWKFPEYFALNSKVRNEKIQLNIYGRDMRFITASYSGTLSLEHAEFSRDIIRSDKYRRMFPEIHIKRDKDLKSNFKNNYGGNRFSTSVGATVTGMHAHFIIIDDPINPHQALSDTERENANDWLDHTLSTRKVDKKVTVTIMIMQRLHQKDPTGHMIDKKGAKIKHIILPGKSDYKVKPKKWRKFYKKGMLDAIRMDKSVLEDLRIALGPYGYAGQIGQDPKPREGGMFQKEWFEIVDYIPKGGTPWVRGWDLAATSEKEAKKKKQSGPAYSAGVRMKYVKGYFYISHVARFRESARNTRIKMKRFAKTDGKKTIIDFPQDPGQAGKSQSQDIALFLAGYDVRYSKESGDKILRANPFSAQCEAGNVKILRGSWNDAFLDEVGFFPNGFKDQVDGSVRAFTRVVKLKQDSQGIVGAPVGVKNERKW